MQLIWAPQSTIDLLEIWTFIAQDDPNAADRIVSAVEAAADMLVKFPRMGRRGRSHGTRELPIVRTPYPVVYRVSGEEVQIARVIHGARDWPLSKKKRA